nr:hypothetical protein [Tanacetum cinerariifolium]
MAGGSTVKEMTTNSGKLDKFEGHDFRRWEKKIYFLLTTLMVVCVMSTPMPELLEDDTNVKSSKELCDSLESKYMAKDASSKNFLLSNFNNYKMVDSSGNKKNNASASGSGKGSKEQSQDQAFYVHVGEIAWWIDSGATTHVCKDRCWFKTYVPMEDEFVLYVGDDHFAHVHGKGSVVLEFSSRKSITLFNVLMFMLNSNKVLDDSGSVYMSSSTVINFSLWHARLGHVHYKRIIEMSKDDLIPAIDENTEKCRIIHETTSLYSPQHNGVVERKNSALNEMVNAMLSYLGLSDGFWRKAMLTACYLLNRVPNKRNKTTLCAWCGHPVDGPYCQGCALLRKKLEEDLVTYFQDFQNTFESFDDSTNVVNAPREPFVVKQDHGVNSSQNPPHIDERCYECGDALDGIFCQRCTCKSYGKSAHIGHNCPPKVLLLAWDRVFEIKDAFGNKQYKPEDIQELFCKLLNDLQNIHEELAEYINTPGWNRPALYTNGDDDDVDYTIAITPVLSTEETDNSLSMGDEHLDTIPETESNELIKSSVEDLVLIPSESEGIPDTIDDDSLYYENIEYVEAPPHDSELVSLEVAEIVIPEVEEIEDDNLHEKLLNANFLIAKIKALKDNPTPSSEFLTNSSSTSPKSFLEETNTFDNSLPEFENFCFDLEEISSDSTTTHFDISLPDYEAFYFYEYHIEEISSGSTTTHSDISLSEYDSFIFDLSNDQFPPIDRSDFTHEEFADELAQIISSQEYDCFYFRNFPYPGEWISSLNSGIRKNFSSTTRVNLPVEDDHSLLLAYVVWIFLAYLTYPVIPPYLHSFGNEDTIFDPGITINLFIRLSRVYLIGVELSRNSILTVVT